MSFSVIRLDPRLWLDAGVVIVVALLTYLAFTLLVAPWGAAHDVAALEALAAPSAMQAPLNGSVWDQGEAKVLCRGALSRAVKDLEKRSVGWPQTIGLRQATLRLEPRQAHGDIVFAPVVLTLEGDQLQIAKVLSQAGELMPSVFFDQVSLGSPEGEGMVLAEVQGRLVCGAS